MGALQMRRSRVGRCAAQSGFTLLEVLVAMAIAVVVATLAYESFSVATEATQRTSAAAERINHIDRALQLLETDLRHAVSRSSKDSLGIDTAAFIGAEGSEYLLRFVRGGWVNPLNQPRSELQRVAYRLADDTLWRDYWFNVDDTGAQEPRQLDILQDVTDIRLRFLPNSVTSLGSGQWQPLWPVRGGNLTELPAAVEVTVELEDMGEITRLFAIAPDA